MKLTKRVFILPEEITKLVPNKNNLYIIMLNYIYNPISYTTTSIAVTSSLTVNNSIESVTASSTVTQAVNYTPIYSTVNGVYITG